MFFFFFVTTKLTILLTIRRGWVIDFFFLSTVDTHTDLAGFPRDFETLLVWRVYSTAFFVHIFQPLSRILSISNLPLRDTSIYIFLMYSKFVDLLNYTNKNKLYILVTFFYNFYDLFSSCYPLHRHADRRNRGTLVSIQSVVNDISVLELDLLARLVLP